ncbi:MAG: murein L,D-transpeptidase catalytic domain family protein [Legionellales bacterium]
MSNLLLLLLAVTPAYFTWSPIDSFQEEVQAFTSASIIPPVISPGQDSLLSSDELTNVLHTQAPNLSEPVINKVVTSLKCANAYNVAHNNILTVIDYSLPSSEKRLWVFDLKQKQLLFNTYVSHGIKSGTLLTNFFSNKYNSKASSIGVYKTEKAYYGREGLSLRLDGLETSFNDNASNRSVVMHGGWYVEEPFIKKYGRPGRSWGCPALPLSMYQPIINTIKDSSLMVVYYPNETWFAKSRFLNCTKVAIKPRLIKTPSPLTPMIADQESRDEVLLADLKKNNRSEDNKAIIAMPANTYEKVFHTKIPLGRMLRRQIDKMEYIALSTAEFSTLSAGIKDKTEAIKSVYFVIPVIKMIRGYAETQMQILPLGTIKEVRLDSAADNNKRYTVYFDNQSAINLRSTDQFIRWLGL